MKKTQMVQIPAGFVCISVDDYAALKITVHQLKDEVLESSRKSAKLVHEVDDAMDKLDEANNRIAELQKELDEAKDSSGYWYTKYDELRAEKIDAVPEEKG